MYPQNDTFLIYHILSKKVKSKPYLGQILLLTYIQEKVTSFWLKNILYLKEVEKGLNYTFGAKNGVEINGSPVYSFRPGGKAINLNSVSSIKFSLDTGKVFKEEYPFIPVQSLIKSRLYICY